MQYHYIKQAIVQINTLHKGSLKLFKTGNTYKSIFHTSQCYYYHKSTKKYRGKKSQTKLHKLHIGIIFVPS